MKELIEERETKKLDTY